MKLPLPLLPLHEAHHSFKAEPLSLSIKFSLLPNPRSLSPVLLRCARCVIFTAKSDISFPFPSMAAYKSNEPSSSSSSTLESFISLPFSSMAGMKFHEASSSPSYSLSRRGRRYDVFLSFRGKDTRKNFTDHLYMALKSAGINVFRDDNELPVGGNISTELLEAIQDSGISIIVFSIDYAASRWCLEELVKILECKKNAQQLVVPIFYHVDPSDVGKQTGPFAKAFFEHEKRFPVDKMSRWRDALEEAGKLKGFPCTEDSLEGEFVKNIVEEIRKHVSIGYLDVAQYPVGLDSHVQKLDYELRVQSNDVRIIGICAMAGMGKTTIAKAFYNHLLHGFEYKGFLDVREESSKNGYLHLQNELLSKILKSNKVGSIPEGITEIRHRLMCTRVLLVLDNVDCSEQLSDLAIMREHGWLASGSKIIITTRDEHLLTKIKVDYRHMVNELNGGESLELFSWHAFSRSHPEEGFVGLSKDVMRYCKGMPLALTVLGSSLYKEEISFWEGTVKKLKSIPNPTIQKTLEISFRALEEPTEKAIFLDVACFFIGVDKDYAKAILDGCCFFPETGITVLIRRCLLTVDRYNKLAMHDLLRDMGREIVCQECPKELGNRSRLWSHDDVLDVLKKHKGTEAVEGLILELSTQNEEHLSTKAFANMRNLRLLQLNYVHLTGSYDHFSKELRWVCWHGFPLKSIPKSFHLENLVVLDMRYSNLRQFSKKIKVLKKLKVLNLSHSYYLTKTPNFSKTPNLEELKLKDCTSLVEVHPSIGNLHRLVLLDMRDCKQLKSLPNSMEDMEALIVLRADKTAIGQVPALKNIKNLSLSGWMGSTRRSSGSVCWPRVSPRESLNSARLMLSSLLGLTSLVSLNLRYCNLSDEVIPKDFGSLYSLKELVLRGNNFCCLRARMSTLPKLTRLDVSYCKSLLSLPELPASLTTLAAFDCNNLVNLPANFNNLPELRELFVRNCTSLQSLPDLPRKLEFLGAYNCTSLERFPNVSRLQGHAQLDLDHCLKLDVNPGWTDLINYLAIETRRTNLVASAVMDIPQNPRFVIVRGKEIPSQFDHQSISPSLCLPVKDYFEDAVLDVCILHEYYLMYDELWLRRYGSLELRSGDQLELLIRPASQKIKFKKWGVHLYDKHKGGTIQSNNVNQILHDAGISDYDLKIGYSSNDHFLRTQRQFLDRAFPFDIDINIRPT